jgi:4'-phosphopantetheinyl transferase
MIDLAPATVDVWRAELAVPDHELTRLSGCLDAEEEVRAARFHLERDRRRFLAARGVLRHILAGYIDSDPREVSLAYGAQGKPFLARHPDLQFNLSHTQDVLVVGVTRGRRVGIDVERTIPGSIVEEVRETVSSEPERVRLDRLDRAARRVQFSQLWTRKEAYIKADGRGMSLDLKRIDVLSLPGQVLQLEEPPASWSSCLGWTSHDLDVGPGLAAALVAEGTEWRPTHLEWPRESR